MTDFSNKKAERIVNIITSVAVTLLMLFLNFNCGYASDDWRFKFIYGNYTVTNGVERIDSFGDIALSVKNYYNSSGGRALCHGLIFFINMFDKPVFNIINSLIFTGFAYASYVLIKVLSKVKNIFIFPVTSLCFILMLPYFGDNCLWLSGAVNYLWSAAIMICCFIAFEKYAAESDVPKMLMLCICVMLSSLTNEVTGGMIIIYMLITFAVGRKFKAYDVIPFILAVIGIIVVVGAPGNSARIQNEMAEPVTFEKIVGAAFEYCGNIFIKCYIYVFIFLFTLLLAAKTKTVRQHMNGLKLFVAGFAGIIALSAAGFHEYRLYFIGCTALICASICCLISLFRILASSYKADTDKIKFSLIVSSLICIAGFIVSFILLGNEVTAAAVSPVLVMVVILAAGLFTSAITGFIDKAITDEALKKKIGNPKKCLNIALVLTITPYIAVNAAILASNNVKRVQWFDDVILQAEQGNYQNLVQLNERTRYPYDFSGAFDADTACFQDPRWYVTSWFAYYNGYFLNTETEMVENSIVQ